MIVDFEIVEVTEGFICANLIGDFSGSFTHFIHAVRREETVDMYLGGFFGASSTTEISVLMCKLFYPDEIDFTRPDAFIADFITTHRETIDGACLLVDNAVNALI